MGFYTIVTLTNTAYRKSGNFVVNIFSDSMASAKIKCTKIMRIINDNAVRGRLSENYLTRNLSHEIFVTRNICDLRYHLKLTFYTIMMCTNLRTCAVLLLH